MAMKMLRDSASGGLGKFILFGFLVLAVGGLILTDVGGFFRGGVSNSDAAIVGKEKISIQTFDSGLRRTLSRIGLSPQEAYKAGYVGQLLGSEIRSRIINQAANNEGVKVDKVHIAKQIKSIIDPYTQQGQDPKDILNQILINQGMSEAAFVESVERDIENNLFSAGLNNGFADVSNAIAKDVYKHNNETRDIEYLVYKNDDLTDIPEATDEQLFNLYATTKESFAQSEARRLTLITVKDDALRSTLEISEDDILSTYEDNIELYTIAENRTLEQALLNTEEQAKAVIDAYNTDQNLKDAVKTATSQTAGYLGEQDVETPSILEDIKEQVLAVEKDGAIIGPIQSPIGWYVVVMKKFNAGKVKPFEDVKADIKEEMIENLLIDQYYELANAVDDLFAGGATLEEIIEQVDVTVQTLPLVNRFGQSTDGTDGFENFTTVKTTALEAGFQLQEKEASPVFETDDGKFMTVYLEALNEKSYTPYEDVKDTLNTRWIQDQKRVSNRIKTMGYLTNLTADGKTISDLSKAQSRKLYKKEAIKRDSDPEGIINQRSVMNIFEAPLNRPILIDVDGGVAIAQITNLKWPEKIDTESATFKSSKEELSAKLQQEGLTLYLEGKRDKFGTKVNQGLLDRIYGPSSENF